MLETLITHADGQHAVSLMQWQHDLVEEFGKINESLTLAGKMVARRAIVNRILIPRGKVVLYRDNIYRVERVTDSYVNLFDHGSDVPVASLIFPETKEAEVTSVRVNGFTTEDHFVETTYIERAFEAMRRKQTVAICLVDGKWIYEHSLS